MSRIAPRLAIIVGDIAKIPLGKHPDKYTIVDKEFAWVDKYFWHIACGYASSAQGRLHRLITQCPAGLMVDHINHDPLDNRLSNLRICSSSQNQQNMLTPKHNKSGFKGVHWNSRAKRWVVAINKNKKPIYTKHFTCKLEAAKHYNEKAAVLFGPYAKLNDLNGSG